MYPLSATERTAGCHRLCFQLVAANPDSLCDLHALHFSQSPRFSVRLLELSAVHKRSKASAQTPVATSKQAARNIHHPPAAALLAISLLLHLNGEKFVRGRRHCARRPFTRVRSKAVGSHKSTGGNGGWTFLLCGSFLWAQLVMERRSTPSLIETLQLHPSVQQTSFSLLRALCLFIDKRGADFVQKSDLSQVSDPALSFYNFSSDYQSSQVSSYLSSIHRSIHIAGYSITQEFLFSFLSTTIFWRG